MLDVGRQHHKLSGLASVTVSGSLGSSWPLAL